MRKRYFPLIELYIVMFLMVLIILAAALFLGYKWGFVWWKAILYAFGGFAAVMIGFNIMGAIIEFITKGRDETKKRCPVIQVKCLTNLGKTYPLI